MKYNYIFFGHMLLACTLHAQRYDAVWPFGFHEFPGNAGWGNAALHFGSNGPITEPLDWLLNFDATSAAIGDADGNLLLATNGCVVVNGQGDTIADASGTGAINQGEVHDLLCAKVGYPVPFGAFILPDPGNQQQYYIFHLLAQYDPETKWTYPAFYYTLIDLAALSGQGLIIRRDWSLSPTGQAFDNISAVRHGNGRDWWIVAARSNSNMYQKWMLHPDGITNAGSQAIGPAINCPRNGSCVFSPDGRKFARTQNCRTVVFDFDRCTGLLSNPVVMNRPEYVFGGGGVAFSPLGRHVFVTEQLAVMAADLQASTPVLDTVVPSDSTIGVSLGLLQAGPDGHLYANSTHRSLYMASFHQTDNLDSLDYRPKAVYLGQYSSRTLPYFPNYRLYDLPDSPCDTLGISPATEAWAGAPPQVRPNPAHDVLHLDFPQPAEVTYIALHNIMGQTVMEHHGWVDAIPVGHLPPGVYVLHCTQQSGGIYQVKIVVE